MKQEQQIYSAARQQQRKCVSQLFLWRVVCLDVGDRQEFMMTNTLEEALSSVQQLQLLLRRMRAAFVVPGESLNAETYRGLIILQQGFMMKCHLSDRPLSSTYHTAVSLSLTSLSCWFCYLVLFFWHLSLRFPPFHCAVWPYFSASPPSALVCMVHSKHPVVDCCLVYCLALILTVINVHSSMGVGGGGVGVRSKIQARKLPVYCAVYFRLSCHHHTVGQQRDGWPLTKFPMYNPLVPPSPILLSVERCVLIAHWA